MYFFFKIWLINDVNVYYLTINKAHFGLCTNISDAGLLVRA